ncbi:MAG TPA: acyltransferase [Polyangiaceae bacterium]|nr:acyltransferase [Polyangiaceae bacterium]
MTPAIGSRRSEPHRDAGSRLPGLDVLRGLCALAVVFFHFTTRFQMIWGHPSSPPFLVPWGQRGVEVFFVVSGFAIELSLASHPTPRDFVEARAVRLFPTFWAALAVTFAVVSVFGLPDRGISGKDALLNLTMIAGTLGVPAADAVYWTLERELRFYALVLVLLAFGRRELTVHALFATVALEALGTRFAIPHALRDLANDGFSHLFAAGAVLARTRRGSPRWTALGVVPCLLGARLLGSTQFVWATVAVALVWLATRPMGDRAFRPLVFLGRISYPLYLVHQYVGYVAMRALYARDASPVTAIAVASALGVSVATVLHFTVERPSLELVRRRRRGSPNPAPGRARATVDREAARPARRAGSDGAT